VEPRKGRICLGFAPSQEIWRGARFFAPHSELDLEDNCPYTGWVRYEWDPAKAAANLETHGVSFAEASTVLSDDFALTREDPLASGEQRLVTLGLSDTGSFLIVVHTYREPDTLRVISAWRANRRQRLEYEKSRR
jgi:uncharacterized protein